MSTPKLVIFDLDGTLIDTVSLFVGSIRAVLADMGQPVPDEKTIRSISGLGLQVGIRRVAPGLDEEGIGELIGRYQRETLARVGRSSQEDLFAGAPELLNELAGRDDMLISVATGKSRAGTDRVLRAHGIAEMFTSIHTPDSNMAKPHPDMILDAMGVAGADRAVTLMIGDTTHDMEMAVAAGVRPIGVNWGYHAQDELLGSGASAMADDFETLLNRIDTLLERTDA